MGALPKTVLQQLLNGMRRLNPTPFVVLPERQRPVLGLDEALAKEVVKNVLEIHKPMVLELELNELSSHGLVAARHLMVRQPQFVVSHDERAEEKPDKPSR